MEKYCLPFALFINFQAEKIVAEIERNCELKLSKCREESKKNLKCVQEEHATLVCVGKDALLLSISLGS